MKEFNAWARDLAATLQPERNTKPAQNSNARYSEVHGECYHHGDPVNVPGASADFIDWATWKSESDEASPSWFVPCRSCERDCDLAEYDIDPADFVADEFYGGCSERCTP